MSGIFNRTIAHGVHFIADIPAIAMEKFHNSRMASDNPALLITV
jgi:hypothetical protein